MLYWKAQDIAPDVMRIFPLEAMANLIPAGANPRAANNRQFDAMERILGQIGDALGDEIDLGNNNRLGLVDADGNRINLAGDGAAVADAAAVAVAAAGGGVGGGVGGLRAEVPGVV